MNDTIKSAIRGTGFLAKIIGITILALVLLLPVGAVRDVLDERMERATTLQAQMSSQWGPQLDLRGPLLMVPRGGTQFAFIVPSEARVEASVPVESRYRGIYAVQTYRADTTVHGVFDGARIRSYDKAHDFDWSRAQLVMLESGSALVSGELTWDGRAGSTIEEHTDNVGLTVVSSVDASALADGKRVTFDWQLAFNGIVELNVAPLASHSTVIMHSGWRAPSFIGDVLPSQRTINAEGFSATWDSAAPRLNTVSTGYTIPLEITGAPTAGVRFVDPVGHYTRVERSVKYAALVILLTFAVFMLFELTTKLRVHPVQYVFIGCALVLFYLLLLSASEHVGFMRAYAIATAATVGLVSMYAAAVLRAKTRALVVAAELTATYGILFVIMSAESLALLAGTATLFAVLATIMFVTRKVDWYNLKSAPTTSTPTVTT